MFLMAAVAVYLTFRLKKMHQTLEFFLSARHSIGALRIGFSFFASAVGAWVISAPPSYGTYAGKRAELYRIED